MTCIPGIQIERTTDMKTEERIRKILEATPDQLCKIDAVLNGNSEHHETRDTRLLTLADAAKALGVSRMTIHRMAAEGRIPTIETRMGRRRVPAFALTDFLEEAKKKKTIRK